MKLSIVATLYQSASYITEFHQRASAVAKQVAGDDYEIIFVNDGSPDNSLDIAIKLTEQDSHLVVVDLSRNFGHHKAMMSGLEQAKGERVFLIDSDLEEEPEWLLRFLDEMEVEQCDVVFGVQSSRKGGWLERWSGYLYYMVLAWMLELHHARNITTARLMTRRYVDALLLYREKEIVISGLWVLAGFKQNYLVVKKLSTSPSTYSFFYKLSHFVNSITSFSSRPLGLIFLIGAVISVASMVYVTFLVINRFYFSVPLDGWTSVMASIWLLGGIIILFIGVIGIYLSKIFSEVKQRPLVIVRDVYGRKK